VMVTVGPDGGGGVCGAVGDLPQEPQAVSSRYTPQPPMNVVAVRLRMSGIGVGFIIISST
jgi:hypothetical protein